MISVKLEIFLFCLTKVFSVKVQELACSAGYGINKMLLQTNNTKEISMHQQKNYLAPHVSPLTLYAGRSRGL